MPFLKGTIGELLFRFIAPSSPFFQPLIKAGAVLAVLAGALVFVKDQGIPALGWSVPAWLQLAIEILGLVSGTIAVMASLTLDEEAVADLNEKKANDLV